MAEQENERQDRHLRAVPDAPQDDMDLASVRKQLADAGAPPELLRALDGVSDPEQFLDVLTDAMPEQPQVPTDILRTFADLLNPDVTPLDAEVTAAEFLGMVRRTAPDLDMTRELLADLMATAEQSGEPHGMAMLRSVAAVAPQGVRDAANETAERLAAAGVAEPAWSDEIGAPAFARAFGYRDDEQECIATVFGYGDSEHAVVTLIDHSLGGGVKDVFLTDHVNVLRGEYERAAEETECELVEHERDRAHQILATALEKPACAEQPEQIDDVMDYRDLLRRRVAVLADA